MGNSALPFGDGLAADTQGLGYEFLRHFARSPMGFQDLAQSTSSLCLFFADGLCFQVFPQSFYQQDKKVNQSADDHRENEQIDESDNRSD